MAFKTFQKGSCPVCGEAGRHNSNSCKRNTANDTLLCRTAVKDNSIKAPFGYTYIGDSKCGTWARFGVKRDDKEQRRLPVRNTKKVKPFTKKGAKITPNERNIAYTKILDKLSLSEKHKQHLLNERGFTLEEIKAAGFRSASYFPEVGKEFFGIPGVLKRGTLNNAEPGILSPVTDEWGNIVALSVRRDNGEQGRYRWLTSSTKKNPNGVSAHIDGELPICAISYKGKAPFILALEGVSFKPKLAALRFKCPVIGASSGNFITSTKLTLKAAKKLSIESQTRRVVIPLDAGDVQNNLVVTRLQRTYEFFTSHGYNVGFMWWGQVSKNAHDIDELGQEEWNNITFLSLKGLKDLAIKWGGIKLEHPRPVDFHSLLKQKSIPDLPEEEEEELTKGQRWHRNAVHREQATLRGLHHPPDWLIRSDNRYLPELLEVVKHYQFVAIKSPKGCGKSRQMGIIKDYFCGHSYWKKKNTREKSPQGTQLELFSGNTPPPPPEEKEEYELVHEKGEDRPFMSITSRIALGRAQAKEHGSEWIDDLETNFRGETGSKLPQKTLAKEVKEISLCVDSILKLAERDWSNHIVFFDEVELNLLHLLTSDTCKEKRSEIIETIQNKLNEVIASGGKIFIADADLSSTTIEFFEKLLGIPAYIVSHEYKDSPRDVYIDEGTKDKFLEEIVDKLQKDSSCNLAVTFSSKSDCIAFETYLRSEYPKLFPNKHDIISVHSDNSGLEFGRYVVENTNEAIRKYKPRLLLYTSSLGVGCSIEVEHFSCVYGIFSGSVEPSQFRQQMARYRPMCDWHIWVKERAHSKTYQRFFRSIEVRENIVESLGISKEIMGFGADFGALVNDFFAEKAFSTLHLEMFCKLKARRNYSLHNLSATLKEELLEAGHNLIDNSREERTEQGEKLTQYKKLVKENDAERIEKAPNIPLESAINIANQPVKTPIERAMVEKAFLQNELPELPLTKDTILKLKDGDYFPAIKRYALLTIPSMLEAKEKKQIQKRLEASFSGVIPFLPDFRSNCPIIRLLIELGIPKFVDQDFEFHKESPEVVALYQKAYKLRQRMRRLLDIRVGRNTDPIKLVERLLNLIGLKKVLFGITQTQGVKTRSYRIDRSYKHDTLRQETLKALIRKHEKNTSKPQQSSDTAKTACSKSLIDNSETVLPSEGDFVQNPNPLLDGLGELLPKVSQIPSEYRSFEALSDIASWLKDCTSKEMLAELLECNIPRLVFALAAKLLPAGIRETVRGWVKALQEEDSGFGDAATA